jgi:hypothetical protein
VELLDPSLEVENNGHQTEVFHPPQQHFHVIFVNIKPLLSPILLVSLALVEG